MKIKETLKIKIITRKILSIFKINIKQKNNKNNETSMHNHNKYKLFTSLNNNKKTHNFITIITPSP